MVQHWAYESTTFFGINYLHIIVQHVIATLVSGIIPVRSYGSSSNSISVVAESPSISMTVAHKGLDACSLMFHLLDSSSRHTGLISGCWISQVSSGVFQYPQSGDSIYHLSFLAVRVSRSRASDSLIVPSARAALVAHVFCIWGTICIGSASRRLRFTSFIMPVRRYLPNASSVSKDLHWCCYFTRWFNLSFYGRLFLEFVC